MGMKRRELITLFVGAASLPVVARAQNQTNANQDANDQVGQVATRVHPLGGTMGKGRERQIILKTDHRTILAELLTCGKCQAKSAENVKQNQHVVTRIEPFSKAMILKLRYAMAGFAQNELVRSGG
jgi:hypothetical protein